MNPRLFLPGFFIFFLLSCSNHHAGIQPGWWKVSKIEILRNNKLAKVIDTGFQYWNFCRRDSILIFERKELQNCLRIKVGQTSIKTFDPETGKLKVEYFIDKLNDQRLELSSVTNTQEDTYKVTYYLDKVEDSVKQ